MSRRKASSTVARKFLDPEQVDEAISELAELAKEQRITAMLAGGVAMQLYGSDRFTKDIDIVVDAPLAGLKETGTLTFGGFTARTMYAKAPVDVILRDDDYRPLYEAALEVPKRIKGVPLPVVTREYLAAMKFAANRGKDLDDLAFLILETSLKIKHTREIIVDYLGYYAAREFDVFVTEVRALGRRR